MFGEQVGHQAHRNFTIFEHVGNARGSAGIVFENVEILVVDPNDIDAPDMYPDIVRDTVSDISGR